MNHSRARAAVALFAGLACIAFVAVVLPEENAEHVNASYGLTAKQKAIAEKIGKKAKAPKSFKVKFHTPSLKHTAMAEDARAKKALKKALKLTKFQKNCMSLKEYAYAAIDEMVEFPSGEGGIAVDLTESLVDIAAQEKLDPDKIPVDTLTPEACVKQYLGFIKNATAKVEKDSIPYFQLAAIEKSMKKGDGILTTVKQGTKPAVVVIGGPQVGLSETPAGWVKQIGKTMDEIKDIWAQVMPPKKVALIAKKRTKIVWGQKQYDALFKPYCGEVDIKVDIDMGCAKVHTPIKCHDTPGCQWQGPWSGDIAFDESIEHQES